MRRRRFLKAVLAGVLLIAAGIRNRFAAAASSDVFRHGVASGDPLDTSVILWTRISTESRHSIDVKWQVAEDQDMTRILASGRVPTDVSRDFTVKVDVDNLPAGATLFYQFRALGEESRVGRTRTLPVGPTNIVKLAVVSCAN
jgi:alkaline phosphatase D